VPTPWMDVGDGCLLVSCPPVSLSDFFVGIVLGKDLRNRLECHLVD